MWVEHHSMLRRFRRKAQPKMKHLVIVILAIFLIDVGLWTAGAKTANTTHRFFAMKQKRDSWFPMRRALKYFNSGNRELLYDHVFFKEKIKFQYPLTSLLPPYFLNQLYDDWTVPLKIIS